MSAREFYRDVYTKVPHNHEQYMDFAEAFAESEVKRADAAESKFEKLYASNEKQCSAVYADLVEELGIPEGGSVLEEVKRLIATREALRRIIEIGKRDMSNPKYDGYFETAKGLLNER